MLVCLVSVDPVAQQVEHNTFNVGVPGSSPGGITEIRWKRQSLCSVVFFYIHLSVEAFVLQVGEFVVR